MGEVLRLGQTALQALDALIGVAAGIAPLLQQSAGRRIVQIGIQPAGPVHIHQRHAVAVAQRQHPQALPGQAAVHLPYALHHIRLLPETAGEHIPRLQAGQRGRAMPHQQIFRHPIASVVSYL